MDKILVRCIHKPEIYVFVACFDFQCCAFDESADLSRKCTNERGVSYDAAM
jgi:hypothetical protein